MSNLVLQQDAQSLHIIINRAEKKNSLTYAMYAELAEAIEAAKDNDNIRVIRISGAGDCFTAGNDLADFVSAAKNADVSPTVRFMKALMQCPKPVVAQVHGLAVGIGTTLLLHCDLVYCATGTKFVLPFINLGLVPEYASSYLLPKLAGHHKAAEWLMLGEPFDAEQAQQCGLVNGVLPIAELSSYVDTIIAKLVAKPHFAMQQTKALMKSQHQQVLTHMDEELDIFIEQLSSEAAKEAFAAFLEKRAPDPTKFR
ncbi:enoyl-CoA hydratase [Alteromonadaceae bacterium BrNp21-10]|nr:enoyl-CoA hydratase [Alteromonadaceae bacterium BrNp21-10]